jgi:hypothetical protein
MIWFIRESFFESDRQFHINTAWFPQFAESVLLHIWHFLRKVKCKDDENVVEIENTLVNPWILEWQKSSNCSDERLIENYFGRKIR